MKSQGMTSKEIADRLGIESPDAVRHFCSVNSIKLPNGQSLIKHDDNDVAVRIREVSDGLLEYISGYETKESPIKIRCNKCGGEFIRTYHNLTTHKPVACPLCINAERERKQQEADERRTERNAERVRRAELAERKREERMTPHACPVCGALTTRPKYCSDRCARKVNNKVHDHVRRLRITNGMVDKDITVEGLFLRDNGVCALCGMPCDINDYRIKDGAFIAGGLYPSIDHIKPLSLGGIHSWDNVQLAHMSCNTAKGNRVDNGASVSRVL